MEFGQNSNQSLCWHSRFKKNFFEILLHVSLRYIKEMVSIVEYRHIFGMVFDDDGPISFEDELKIFLDVQSII